MPLRIRLPSCVMYTKGKELFVAPQESGASSSARELYVSCREGSVRRCGSCCLAGSRTKQEGELLVRTEAEASREWLRETEFKETWS